MMETPWNGAMTPFNLLGNTWFVGIRQASSHLIDTGEGLILLDTGYQENLYLLLDSIYRCGFSPYDIRYIIHSHGHIDHAAGTRALVELIKAETFIGEGDRDIVNGRRGELTWAAEFGMSFNYFEPDHILHDGDRITLGNVSIDCVATPGHTPGVFSYFWDIEADGRTYRAGTFGGAGLNSLQTDYIRKYDLAKEDWRGAFRQSLLRCRREKVDVFIGNHANQNQTLERYQRILDGEKLAFVDAEAWDEFLDGCQQGLDKLEIEQPLP